MTIPPTEFTASTATVKFALAIASRSTSFRASTCSMWRMFHVSSLNSVPRPSTPTNSNASASAIRRTSLPCSSLRNSPFSFGLCDAVMIMPPQAFMPATATSVVGVLAKPMLTTSNPIPRKVEETRSLTIPPDSRASRPTTITLVSRVVFALIKAAYAAVNFTTSSGLRPSPG